MILTSVCHGDVIKWKHFPRYWPFVRGMHRSPVSSTHKGQWRGALMFSLICTCMDGWVNNHEAGDLRRHHAYYAVTVMQWNYRLTLYVPELCLFSSYTIYRISDCWYKKNKFDRHGINHQGNPDSKVHGANMRPTWVLSAPDGSHVGLMKLAIREACSLQQCAILDLRLVLARSTRLESHQF